MKFESRGATGEKKMRLDSFLLQIRKLIQLGRHVEELLILQ